MRLFSILFLSIAIRLCLGFSVTDHSSKRSPVIVPTEKDSLFAVIQGDWRCVDIWYEEMYETCCNEPMLGIHILNDTIFHVDYPHQFYYTTTPADLVLSHDTLIIAHKYFYKRQTEAFDPAILKILKTDTINPESLIGTWQLDTWREMGYEGEENYDGTIEFPFKLKPVLTFTKKTVAAPVIKGRKVMIPVNGVNKSCFIVSIDQYRIILRCESSREPDFEFTYNRKS